MSRQAWLHEMMVLGGGLRSSKSRLWLRWTTRISSALFYSAAQKQTNIRFRAVSRVEPSRNFAHGTLGPRLFAERLDSYTPCRAA